MPSMLGQARLQVVAQSELQEASQWAEEKLWQAEATW
jgi:hypothetical protein